jgi:hypothetical protein
MTVPRVEFEDPDNLEEMDNLELTSATKVVLNMADWTTETILSQLARENIDLKPRFQRRDAWTRTRKSRFLESILLGLPIPQIVLAERRDTPGHFLVLDGKQRLLSLYQFVGRAEGKNNAFRLTGLQVREDLNGQTFEAMQTISLYRRDLDAFLNQTIRTVVIRNWPSVAFLHLVFLRLNTSSTALSPQELRQALFPGPFLEYVDDRAAESATLQALLGNTEPDFRMRDTEIAVRSLAFRLFMGQYSGSLSGFLDFTCEKLNAEWESVSHEIATQIDQIEAAIGAAKLIFGEDNVGRKWTQAGFERRLNRAVLDVITFYFSDAKIRETAVKKRQSVLEAFKALCEDNAEFRQSVETTTKSLGAVHKRFVLWGTSLRKALRIQFRLPEWSKERNRLEFESFW